MSTTPPEDQRICDWFESQTEEFINDLMEKHGYDLTPRKAWLAFLGSSAAQESQSESVPAPAEAVQQVATPTLEQFQRWLETRAHEANAAFDGEPLHGDDMATHQWRCALMVNSCRTATSLLMHFKLEQGS